MNKFMRVLLLNALTLLCAHGIFAKTLNVKIRSIQRAGTEVAKSIAARIQATERYTVKDGDAELFIDINCMEGKEISSASGYICSFVFVYYPDKLANMEYVLGPIGLVTDPDVSSVAEDVFDTFTGSTTNEKLERAQKSLRIGVLSYCYNHSNKDVISDCGQNAVK
jgi:hypothetical protein